MTQVQRIIDLLDGIVDAGPTPATLAPVRTALVGLRDEPDEPNRADNTFEVIRQAALRYLHGEDGTGTPPLAEELATLADALGVPHSDVEAL